MGILMHEGRSAVICRQDSHSPKVLRRSLPCPVANLRVNNWKETLYPSWWKIRSPIGMISRSLLSDTRTTEWDPTGIDISSTGTWPKNYSPTRRTNGNVRTMRVIQTIQRWKRKCREDWPYIISHLDLLMCRQPEHTFLLREIGCPEYLL